MKSIELFAGAGGLAIGLKEAGFIPQGIVEFNKDACKTLRANPELVEQNLIYEGDISHFSYSRFADSIDLVSGGPPCQPFSLGGKGNGFSDNRDMFPEAVRAIQELAPKAFVFKNVKGLLRKNFSDYFEYILLQLEYPLLRGNPAVSWQGHLDALRSHRGQGSTDELSYDVSFKLLNSANFGVPQKRERVFIVGFRKDLRKKWQFPIETHSEDALVADKLKNFSYWEKHSLSKPELNRTSSLALAKFEKKYGMFTPETIAWVTVRDAISSLPIPTENVNQNCSHHVLKFGAKSYPGHTGSYIDLPSKTLKAGVHGVPGGENMVRFEDGTVRYFTVRESARIQSFPDSYQFEGSWGEVMRQLGNAVPAKLAKVVGDAVYKTLRERQVDISSLVTNDHCSLQD